MSAYYVGLLSGTSRDAIDVAVVRLDHGPPGLIHTLSYPFPAELRTALADVSADTPLGHIAALDIQLGRLFADAVQTTLQQAALTATEIRAIASHGQTVLHHPHGTYPASIQLGDPNVIAQQTRITVVADFRRRDIAAGGQGAPLVPAFHQACLANTDEPRVVLNIGGIANITALPSDPRQPVLGFDTGPGNCLLDSWAEQHLGAPLDAGGQWSRQGHTDATLLARLLTDPYFYAAAPKSTGREHFNLAWLQAALQEHPTGLSPVDVQATLVALTAQSVAMAVDQWAPAAPQILVCGGGVHNRALMEELRARTGRSVESTARFGLDPDWVEAMAFAWLARCTLQGQPGNLTTVTGARDAVPLGGIYPRGG